MLDQRQYFFGRNVFVIICGASGPGVRSIQKVAQWDNDFSCVGIVKQRSLEISRRSAREDHWSCFKSAVTLIPVSRFERVCGLCV